jgi:hypothetical protein
VDFANGLPVIAEADGGYSLVQMTNDLLVKAEVNLNSNTVVIPVLQVLHGLLEGGVLKRLAEGGTQK